MPQPKLNLDQYAQKFWDDPIVSFSKISSPRENWINQTKFNKIVNFINENLETGFLQKEFHDMVKIFVKFPKKYKGKTDTAKRSRNAICEVNFKCLYLQNNMF
jgi:hypothetical protein